MSARRLAPLLAAAALAVGACGGDDDGDGGGLSKSELDKQSATICRDSLKKLNDLPEPQNLQDPKRAQDFLTDVVEIYEDTISKLRGLEPEDSLKADYDAYLDVVEENGDELKSILDKAEAKDPSGFRDLQRFLGDQERNKRTKGAAREAGLTGCANT